MKTFKEILFEGKKKDNGDHWVTINGRHVQVTKDGTVIGGVDKSELGTHSSKLGKAVSKEDKAKNKSQSKNSKIDSQIEELKKRWEELKDKKSKLSRHEDKKVKEKLDKDIINVEFKMSLLKKQKE